MTTPAIRHRGIWAAVALAALFVVVLAACPVAVECDDVLAQDGVTGSLEHVYGISVVRLAGTPREMGYMHARLLGDRLLETEAAFKSIMPPIPGGFIGEWLARLFVMFHLDSIEDNLTAGVLEEMMGMAEGGPDRSRDYRDLLYYHVLQDIGQNYACTGGAACGSASMLKGPVAGRNFDLNKDGELDALKTVFFYDPDEGQSYASVAWPGMAGAVTGINEHGLCVMVFSARSGQTSLDGVPVAFLARRVLADAVDVGSGIEIIKSAERMGPDTFLLVDSQKAVAVEFDAGRLGVRPVDDGMIAVSNHFLSAPFSEDGMNAHQARYTDSRQRYDRMERMQEAYTKADETDMACMLRDHCGSDGAVMAWGDPAAVNNIKCAHSVVFDPAGRRFWVSTAPSAYGTFVGFRITVSGLERAEDLPASEYQFSGEGIDARESQEYLARSIALADDGFISGAMESAWTAMAVDTSNYLAAIQYGRLCMDEYRYADAYDAFDSAARNAPDCYPAMADALAGRGEAARKLGRRGEARADFERVLDMGCSEEASESVLKGLARM